MEEHIRLLMAISPDPRGDVHRLVYADWLEDQGHPLTELLRLQYEIAVRPENDPTIPVLHARELALVEDNAIAWQFYKELFWVDQVAALKLERDVLALSRRDPIESACPYCHSTQMRKWTPADPLVLRWMLNPTLALNEMVFAQRIPRLVLTCLPCKDAYTRCVACRRVQSLSWWRPPLRHTDFVCPDCTAPIPMVRNLVAGAIVDLGSLAVRAVAAAVRGRSRV